MAQIRIKSGTRAQLDAAALANGLVAREPYFITDESRFAVGAATNAYQAMAKQGEGAPPSGGAGGVLSGSYPNPGFAVDMATQAELDAVAAAKLDKGYATHTDTAGTAGIVWPALQFLVQKFTAAASIAGAIRFAGIRRYEFESAQSNSGAGHHVAGMDWYVHKGSGNPNVVMAHEAKMDIETAATVSVAVGAESQLSSNAGTVTNLYGHRSRIAGNAGTIGAFTGYRADVTSNSGTLGTVIGYEFPDLSALAATARSAFVNRDPGAPILSAAPIIDQSLTYAAPSATGFTVTIPDKRQMLLLTPAAAYAAGTINFPAKSGAADGQFVEITTSQAVTAVTWGANGASYVLYGPAGLAAGQTVRFRYFAALDWWVFVSGDAPITAGIADAPSDGKNYGRKDGSWQEITAGGGTAGRMMIPIMAGSMQPSASGGSGVLTNIATTANMPDVQTLNFHQSTQQHCQFAIPLPKRWNRGTITARFRWSHAATTTNFGVMWAIQAVAVGDNEAINQAYGTAAEVTDTGGTTNRLFVSDETAAFTVAGTPADGDTIFFRVYRKAAAAADTLAIVARLHGVDLFVTTNAENDA